MLKKTLLSVGAIVSTIVPSVVSAQIVNFDDTTKYPSEEEAIKTGENKKIELETDGYTDVKYEVTEATEKVKVEKEEVKEESNTEKDAYTDLTKDEADSKKAELEAKSTETTIISVEIKSSKVNDEDAAISETMTFDSEEAMNTYVNGLKALGYKVETSNLTKLTSAQTHTLTGTYETEEEAKTKVDEFNKEYETTNGIYDPVRNTKKEEASREEGTTRYETEADANTAANALASENATTVVAGDVQTKTEDVNLEDVITKTFASEEAAEAYIETLRIQGYTINSGDYEISKEEKTVVLTVDIKNGSNSVRIDDNNRANLYIRYDGVVQHEDGTTYYSTSEYRYVGSAAVSTGQWYDVDADKHQGDLAYLVDVNNNIANYIVNNGEIKDIEKKLKEYGITLKKDEVIVWYVLKNATDEKKQEITYYKLDKNGNKISKPGKPNEYETITVKLKPANYHIDGVIMSKTAFENIYRVTGSGEKQYYTVDTLTTTKVYDYKVSGSVTRQEENGKVSAKVDATIEKDVYSLDVTTTTKTTEMVEVYEDSPYYVLTITADDAAIMGEGGEEIDPEDKKLVQTGSELDNSNLTASLATIALVGATTVAVDKKKKGKKGNK